MHRLRRMFLCLLAVQCRAADSSGKRRKKSSGGASSSSSSGGGGGSSSSSSSSTSSTSGLNVRKVRTKASDLIAVNLADSEGKRVLQACKEAYERGNDMSLPTVERAAAYGAAVSLDIRYVDWLVRRKGPFDNVYRILDRALTLTPNSPTLKNLRDVAEVIDDLLEDPPDKTEPPSPAQIMVWEGMTVEVGGNIGNTLCYYVAAAAVNFVSGRDFAPSSFHRPMHNNPRLPKSESDDDYEDEDEDYDDDDDDDDDTPVEDELVPLPRIVQYLPTVLKLSNYPEVADLLEFVGGGPLSVSPPTAMDWSQDRGILRAMQPVLSDVVEAALFAATADRPHSGRPSKSDIVVHFRCSDVPFSKHPSYHFLTYEWWREAMRTGSIDLLRAHKRDPSILGWDGDSGGATSHEFVGLAVEIIACPSWNIAGADAEEQRQACEEYTASLARFLETLPAVRTPVKLSCRSADEDFEVMVNAPLLIGSGSSMSTVAAHAARWPRVAVVPDTSERITGDGFPSVGRLPPRKGLTIFASEGYRVPHDAVDSYTDTAGVISLLSSSRQEEGGIGGRGGAVSINAAGEVTSAAAAADDDDDDGEAMVAIDV